MADVRGVHGFTLIELMITVAIVAILAAIAVPMYQDSIWKAKRAEAKGALMKALQAEERYYSANNTYLTYNASTAQLPGAFPIYSADSASNSRYTIAAVAQGTAPMCTDNDKTKCVVITATVVGNPDPNCGASLSIDTIGNRTSDIVKPVCWN